MIATLKVVSHSLVHYADQKLHTVHIHIRTDEPLLPTFVETVHKETMHRLVTVFSVLGESLRIVFHYILRHPLVLVNGLLLVHKGEQRLQNLNHILAFDKFLELSLFSLDIVGHDISHKILLLCIVLVEGLLRDAKLAADVINGHLADSIL